MVKQQQDNALRCLGTVIVLVLYACAWSTAHDSTDAWVDSQISEGGPFTAPMVAQYVITVLTLTWAWVLLVVVLMNLLQMYILSAMRASSRQSRYGNVSSISFDVLRRWNVVTAFLASILCTYIFAWVITGRALSQMGKQTAGRVKREISECITNVLVFNLAAVVVSVLLSSAVIY